MDDLKHQQYSKFSPAPMTYNVTYKPEQSKPGVLDEVLHVIRKLLKYCLCCITCGCYPGPQDTLEEDLYEAELTEDERTAVHNLLKYLDSAEAKSPIINEERLRALCILTYSDNQELQRSAALCFAELSERMSAAVTEIVLEPLVVLIKSRDVAVQRAATLAVSNYALTSAGNKTAIVNSGALRPLVQLLHSDNVEVQCNTCGCITTLASTEKTKQEVVSCGGVKPLLQLAQSQDIRVKRNATGAILNLTHLQLTRNELVQAGALPVLVQLLHSDDSDVHYYCTAALSNLAVNEKHRTMMVAIGHYDVLRSLVRLLGSNKEKVCCQSCLALRNLASDVDSQVLVVQLGGLPQLHSVIKSAKGDTLAASIACVRNLSIHKINEEHIIRETFLSELKRVVKDGSNPQAQSHAAGTIRNLAAGDHIEYILHSGCVDSLTDVLVSKQTHTPVLVEVTAALAVLADEDEAKQKLLSINEGSVFERLVSMTIHCENTEICYNCAGIIGQITLLDSARNVMEENKEYLVEYMEKFLTSADLSHVHIALWTLTQLLRFDTFVELVKTSYLVPLVEKSTHMAGSLAIQELAEGVLKMVNS